MKKYKISTILKLYLFCTRGNMDIDKNMYIDIEFFSGTWIGHWQETWHWNRIFSEQSVAGKCTLISCLFRNMNIDKKIYIDTGYLQNSWLLKNVHRVFVGHPVTEKCTMTQGICICRTACYVKMYIETNSIQFYSIHFI